MNLPSCRPIAPPLTTLPPGAEGSTVGRLVSPGADDDQTDALYAIYRDDETDAVASSSPISPLRKRPCISCRNRRRMSMRTMTRTCDEPTVALAFPPEQLSIRRPTITHCSARRRSSSAYDADMIALFRLRLGEKSSTYTGGASAVRIPTRERSLLASLPRLVQYG